MEKIEVKMFDLENEKIIECLHSYIELHENSFTRSYEVYSQVLKNSDDTSLGYEEPVFSSEHYKFEKKSICAIGIKNNKNIGYWYVTIDCNGFPDTINTFFKTNKEAKVFFNLIDNWWSLK